MLQLWNLTSFGAPRADGQTKVSIETDITHIGGRVYSPSLTSGEFMYSSIHPICR
jgi:hypothetical protein